MTKRPGRPLEKVSGPWTPFTYGEDRQLRETLPYFRGAWRKRVAGGGLRAILSEDVPGGWHLSVSFAAATPTGKARYPSWDEIADARYELLPSALTFVLFLPPPEEYVNLHDTCFHLHEYPERHA